MSGLYTFHRAELFLAARRLAWAARIVGAETDTPARLHPDHAVLMRASTDALRSALAMGSLLR